MMLKTKNKPEINKTYIYFVAFLAGAIILIIEILGTRIIAPFFGTTVYVWSSLIGVTLLSLAAGYFYGGYMADKRPEMKILHYIMLAAGVIILFIPAAANPVLKASNFLGPRFGSLAASFLLFAIPLFLLGAVTPFAVRLNAGKIETIGVTAGSLYGISTAGSFLGAIAAGFFLIPNMGIRMIIDIIGVILIIISLSWMIFNLKRKVSTGAIVLFLVVFGLRPGDAGGNEKNWKVHMVKHGPYAEIKVMDSPNRYRFLSLNGATQTIMNLKNGQFDAAYISMFEEAALYADSPESALVIGLGGGAVGRKLKKYGIETTYVEVDPVVIAAAKKYFGFKGRVIEGDGRNYIRNTQEKYDIIYIDAYNGYSIYPYIFSKEAFEEIKCVMKEGGILAINAIGRHYRSFGGGIETDEVIKSVYSTLNSVFKHTELKAETYGVSSFVFYSSDGNFKVNSKHINVAFTGTGRVITDNFNPVDYLVSEVSEEWLYYQNRVMGINFPI